MGVSSPALVPARVTQLVSPEAASYSATKVSDWPDVTEPSLAFRAPVMLPATATLLPSGETATE